MTEENSNLEPENSQNSENAQNAESSINAENPADAAISQTPCEPLAPLPQEIKKFNWGAFFLTWIWGIGNRSYLTFFAFLAYFIAYTLNSLGVILPVCLAFNIYCGIMGNSWAWKNKTWESTDYFNRIQKRWAMGGVLFFIITRLLTILLMFLFFIAVFYLLYPTGHINKPADWAIAGKKGATSFVKYSVETTLDGTNMSKIENSNELAREIASGLDVKSSGNTVFLSSNGNLVLKVYKDGICSLEKKNCSVRLDSLSRGNYVKNFKFYIDENKKLVPFE